MRCTQREIYKKIRRVIEDKLFRQIFDKYLIESKKITDFIERRHTVMKVILLQDVKSLGKKGAMVEVSEGYARNFIIPKKLGVEATPKNINDQKLKKAHDEKVAAENLAEAKALAAELEKSSVTVKIKVGEGGRSFGSVSTKEISDAIKTQLGKDIDKKKVVMKDPIKAIGSFTVKIKLHPEVQAELSVKVEEA